MFNSADLQLFSGGSAGGFYPKTIDQSLRFNDNDSAYLSRTPASAGNQKTWTWSGWVKRGNLGTLQGIFSTYPAATPRNFSSLDFGTTDSLQFLNRTSGDVFTGQCITNAKFRDPSAWYHIVLAIDTTQATSSDRIKLFVNGVAQSFSSATYLGLNEDTDINSARATGLFAFPQPSSFFDGYVAEVHFCDGTAYTADDFGELKSGIWVAKEPSVTYGTNGFYLNFSDSGAIGDDLSGNANDWTANNLAATDVVPDSPTNNFATWNSIYGYGTTTSICSEGNLKIVANGFDHVPRPTMKLLDKTYAEFYINNGSKVTYFYVTQSNKASSIYYLTTGSVVGGAGSTSVASATTGDIIGIYVSVSDDTVEFKKNNVSLGVFSLSGNLTVDDTLTFELYNQSSATITANFGQDSSFAGNKTAQGNTDANGLGDFYYAPPTGALALCTANLPEPVFDPAADVTPEDHFNVVTWTGDNTSSRGITSVGFQPDFVWLKRRNPTLGNHQLVDAVRGYGTSAMDTLFSNLTNAEVSTNSGLALEYGNIQSLDTDGFTVAAGTNGSQPLAEVNETSYTYVAWCFKAGGTPVTNTDGSITSSVSANVDAGFSIVSYSGNSVLDASIGHGLSQAPELYIIKNRNGAYAWITHTTAIDGTLDYLYINLTNAAASTGSTLPTDTVMHVYNNGEQNQSGFDYIAYCWHSVEGFSKIGTYTGNGSTDGPFVYCGFKPAFIMVKRTNSTGNWVIVDNERLGYNIDNKLLYPNLRDAESGGGVTMDFLSNGFKPRFNSADYNASGSTYLFMAFAENPFKYSTAR